MVSKNSVRIAHLTDIHLPLPANRISWRDLLTKRLTGFANWHRNRKRRHLRSVVDRLVADMHTQDPDHIAVTGDLVNLGLPSEFRAALDWLRTLGPAERISVIPGNHDTYVANPEPSCFEVWAPFMQTAVPQPLDLPAPPVEHAGVRYPHTHMIGDHVALIALSSAIPTQWFNAEGNLGDAQCEILPAILDTLRDQEMYRIITIHHPPTGDLATRRKGLRDAARLTQILRDHGAELVLYGHNHVQKLSWLDTRDGAIPLVCAPSLSAASPSHPPLGRYNLYDVSGTPGAWQCRMTGRGLTSTNSPVTAHPEEDLSPRR